MSKLFPVVVGLLPIVFSASVLAQEPQKEPSREELEKRVQALEKQVKTHGNQLDSFGHEIEGLRFDDVIRPLGERAFGLGQAASKIYHVETGLSWGGYGEVIFSEVQGGQDVADAQRIVNYIGYRYDEHFVFNSEIEVEHGSTSASSGSTTSGGSVSAEFAYIDYLHSDEINGRAGLMLVPMGLTNENHEPTAFFGAERPVTENRIIPTTWRAVGAGIFGQVGDVSYRVVAINSLSGEEFSSSGLRSGRQKGNRAASNDFAGVVRMDYQGCESVCVGGSVFYGPAGQDNVEGATVIPDLDTFIGEVHAEVKQGPFSLRALYALATVKDSAAYNTAASENLAKEMHGHYVEAGCNVMGFLDCESKASVTPFLRYEGVDTQAEMAAGFVADSTKDVEIITVGVEFKPIEQVVFKLDFADWDKEDDRFHISMGYLF